MEIIVGKTAGFCYGVKRAIDGSMEQIDSDNLFCLGEIVHNNQVIKKLEQKGLKFINEIEEINSPKAKMIIRAHGVQKDIYKKADKKNIEVIDYTCPNVLKIHEIAEKYAKKGFYIILCGKKEHPENIGTISYCGKNYYVVQNEDEVDLALNEFKKLGINKLLLISQTTYSLEKFDLIQQKIENTLQNAEEVIIKNTICRATELRQKETQKLSKEVDSMIIIGGKNSSNTLKLYDIARDNCKHSICIETEQELQIEDVKNYTKIGIMAGASTPKESIDNVIKKIKSIPSLICN